ncbi:hypothetical protein ACFSQD_08670 [Flavihumibacter stibioxidans]|uniref:Lipocalin-like domain-containing protein n=1 Tax=Flavihumibacter stibioxidans TaxID=1834163 RepID=A0ABR7M5T1_9BACT|nr:hypothetical protein [Flavihumibacter stibioxidans]MBC6490381.1 hypothetical protein [Flavihumibacter stibioxidans]
MRYSLLTPFMITLLVLSKPSSGQTNASFDLVNYMIPGSWKRETGNGSVSHTIIDERNGDYAKIIVYKSIPGSGNLQADFEAEWSSLVSVPYKTNTPIETAENEMPDGWKVKSGTVAFTFNNRNSAAVLITGSHKAIKLSMVVLTNTTAYQQELDAFSQSIEFRKVSDQTADDLVKIAPTPPAISSGFTFTTSNFDDGWTSTVQEDWVMVTKGKTNVYLLYALPYNADQFTGTGIMARDYYWDQYVSKYFTIISRQYQDNGEFVSSFKPAYVEGRAVNRQTGENCFIAMTLEIAPNTAYLTIASTPDEATMRRQFPKGSDRFASDLTAMNRYNKFAVAGKDITGTWQNGNNSTAQWYYISPAGYESYAGMTLAATSSTFHFNGNGSYSSIHNGATGAVGNMNTFQQEYKGNFSVSNWNITATNRYEGKTDRFDASFKAIRGGRILQLNNGAGQYYHLVKIK